MSHDRDAAQFLTQAIMLARENVESGAGGPFGAVVVKNGEVIATGTNLVTASDDPTAHAEVVAIRNACESLGTFQLDGCEIYCSCEPCPMCLGAIYWARPVRVVFASTAHDAADAGFDDSFIYDEVRRPRDRRRLPLEQLRVPQAGEEFIAWMENEDRIEY
ncbi:MAG: nucleoside deaminase [Gemmatimonadota bacterium]|nr:nucleoside deaminase [Gemmatimonadota bacterium]MDH3426817.1 nucleoside deaminase [Gemmatimonadota bacterium]